MGISVARRVHQARQAMLAAVDTAADEPALAAALADAQQQLNVEANVLEDGRLLLARSRTSVGEAIAAGDPEASGKAIAAARHELDTTIAAGARTLGTVGQVFERLDRAATHARIQQVVREREGRWLVTGVYFVPGRDRIRPAESRAALDDLATLLQACARITIEITARPRPDVDPPHAISAAAARAFELESYLVQTGVPADRLRRIREPAALAPALDPGPLVPHRRAWTAAPPDGVEDGLIVVRVVRPCP